MKFKTYLETISGVGIYPLISLLVFFVFFTGCVIYALKADPKMMDKMKSSPLDEQ